jgi:predicted Zn-dependent protease
MDGPSTPSTSPTPAKSVARRLASTSLAAVKTAIADLGNGPNTRRVSDAEEMQIGDQLAEQYASRVRPRLRKGRALQKYVNEVGKRVTAHAKRRLEWHFHVLIDPALINAFALPGGQIFVGSGLLDQLKSEDELAFVLGHEIET